MSMKRKKRNMQMMTDQMTSISLKDRRLPGYLTRTGSGVAAVREPAHVAIILNSYEDRFRPRSVRNILWWLAFVI